MQAEASLSCAPGQAGGERQRRHTGDGQPGEASGGFSFSKPAKQTTATDEASHPLILAAQQPAPSAPPQPLQAMQASAAALAALTRPAKEPSLKCAQAPGWGIAAGACELAMVLGVSQWLQALPRPTNGALPPVRSGFRV